MSFKPDGYSSMSPYVIVADARAHLAFADAVFGAERLRFLERTDGTVEHAEIRIDDTVVMFCEAGGGADYDVNLHLYCPDPDALMARAAEAGAIVLQPVSDREDGDRRGGFRGPKGVAWWVSRRTASGGSEPR
ncbi:MAG: VOC family protein [Pseudomonadota bacterium]